MGNSVSYNEIGDKTTAWTEMKCGGWCAFITSKCVERWGISCNKSLEVLHRSAYPKRRGQTSKLHSCSTMFDLLTYCHATFVPASFQLPVKESQESAEHVADMSRLYETIVPVITHVWRLESLNNSENTLCIEDCQKFFRKSRLRSPANLRLHQPVSSQHSAGSPKTMTRIQPEPLFVWGCRR